MLSPSAEDTFERGVTIMQTASTNKIPSSLLRLNPSAIALAAVLFLASGCATDQQRTRLEGAGLGVLIGGVLGTAVGGRDGAAVGALAGGAAGAVYADQQANKKQEFAEREDALKLAAAQAQQLTLKARDANEGLQRDIVELNGAVKQLKTQRMDARRRSELALVTQRRMQQAIARVDEQLTAVRGEISRQQQALQRDNELARSAPAVPPPSLRLVRVGVNELQSQERTLERVKAQLAQLDPSRAY
jgi:hypothetical protein